MSNWFQYEVRIILSETYASFFPTIALQDPPFVQNDLFDKEFEKVQYTVALCSQNRPP